MNTVWPSTVDPLFKVKYNYQVQHSTEQLELNRLLQDDKLQNLTLNLVGAIFFLFGLMRS